MGFFVELSFRFWSVVSVAAGPGLERGSDREAVERFEKIFDANYSKVMSYFRRLTGPASSEDLCQETFLRAYRNLEKFRGESAAWTWLRRIAQNVWLNHLRDRHAKKRQAEEVSLTGEAHEPASAPTGGAEPLIRDERVEALRAAIRELPAGMRHCVWLRVYQDMSYQEIATVLDSSVASTKSQVSLACKRLKTRLGDRYPELMTRLGEESGP